jgi:hypothetical protein
MQTKYVNGGNGNWTPAEPLPTKPFPEVTRFEIVSPEDDFEVEQGDSRLLKIETDADAEFDRREFIQFRCEPDARLRVVSKTPLNGGRMRFRVRAYDATPVGSTGLVIATLMIPGGKFLEQTRRFKITAATDKGTKKKKGLVPPFEITFIDPETPAWPQVWPDHEDTQDQLKVAYKALKSAGKLHVYVSKIFPDYADQVEALKNGPNWRLAAFNTQYKIWIGYHAIIQDQGKGETAKNLDEADADRILELERVRVAKMQVRQALKTADLQREISGRKN